jgi:hypothetical protein
VSYGRITTSFVARTAMLSNAPIPARRTTSRPVQLGRLNMDLPVNCPLIRALMRVEAELILMDAEAMAHGRFEHRTSDQRRGDAFMELALRAADVRGN